MKKLKLSKFELFNPSLTMESPFVTSLRKVEELNPVLVKAVADDGTTGWGEAPVSPQVTGETPDSSLSVLKQLMPKLLGLDPRDREKIHSRMKEILKGNRASKAGIDIAVHDLLGKAWNVPLWKLLGGFRSSRITTDFTVSLDEPDLMANKTAELVAEGFTEIKVKLGGKLVRDLERIESIEKAGGPETSFRIDANQGWTRTEAAKFVKETKNLSIQFLEQPLDGEDIEGMKRLRETSPYPIMADESVHGLKSAREVFRRGAADYINIKLSKAGGFFPASKLAALAEAYHVPCMIGGMSSTGILSTAAAHFAAGVKNVRFGDLDMGTSIDENVIKEGGSHLDGNYRVLSGGNGLGIKKMNEEVLGAPVETYELQQSG